MSTPKRSVTLLPATTIAAAATAYSQVVSLPLGCFYLAALAKFLYGAGGTSVKAYLQTSLDGGTTWIDIMCFAFTTAAASKVSAVVATTALAAAVTPGDATLTDNTILSGLLGDRIRVKYISVGTYTGATSLAVEVTTHQ